MNLPFDNTVLYFWLPALQPILTLVVLAIAATGLSVALIRRTLRPGSPPSQLPILQEAVESFAGGQDREDTIQTALSFASRATGARFAALAIGNLNETSADLYSLCEGQVRTDKVGLAPPDRPQPGQGKPTLKRKGARVGGYRPLCSIPAHYPSLQDSLGIAFRTSTGDTGELFVGNKPEAFTSEDETTLALLANQVTLHLDFKALLQQINHGYLETIEALVNAIEAKDAYTRGHSDRVTKYAIATAKEMCLPPEQVEEIRVGAVLHDIGKIGVPERIINKPGRLDDDEWRLMKDHPRLATKIIDSFNRSRDILLMIYHHHEMYDGTGYPIGLRGNEIPLAARILKVADAFEAMTSHRPYQTSKTLDQATKELKDWSGRQFDPLVVNAFLRTLRERSHELDLDLIEAN